MIEERFRSRIRLARPRRRDDQIPGRVAVHKHSQRNALLIGGKRIADPESALVEENHPIRIRQEHWRPAAALSPALIASRRGVGGDHVRNPLPVSMTTIKRLQLVQQPAL